VTRQNGAFKYKKGDKVIFLNESYDRIQLEEGVVLMVKKAMPVKKWDGKVLTLPVVYVSFTNRWGGVHSKKFCAEYGPFQENPHPIWRIRHLTNGNMRGLEKRASHATKLHQAYLDEAKKIEADVDQEARDWKYKELDRRKKEIPHGGMYLRNVVARLGFRRPQSG